MLEITQQDDGRKGYFEAAEYGIPGGKMTYTWTGDSAFIIDHTEVNEALSGRGVGKKLLMAAVEFARNKNVKIIPLCPFARKMFERTEAIRDVLK